ELFFLDEAVALAAGHRPCAECRRADYRRFVAAFDEATRDRMDRRLHQDRVDPRTRAQIRHSAWLDALPDGTFITHGGRWCLVRGRNLFPFADDRYDAPVRRPVGGEVTVLTPRCTVAALRAGYVAEVHQTAR